MGPSSARLRTGSSGRCRMFKNLGADWIAEAVDGLTDTLTRVGPVAYNEATRYLPNSVTSLPGYIRYDVNPFMREIVECFDVDSEVREVNLMKGVQITYTTALESGLLYYMGHVKTLPLMYMTADKELAAARVENNIIPMLNLSGLGGIIRSSDELNTRKTGKTKDHLQFEGGGYLVPFGAKNADKMRSYSIAVMLKDEIDAWPDTVGKDGDPDSLSDDRLSAYWTRRKIFRGSTPLILGKSKIFKQYRRGDARKYMVLCKACGFPQELRWHTVHEKTGLIGGFQWDHDDGTLVHESVRYCCQECGHPHYEMDKERLFSADFGAGWVPTKRPVEPGIRSYHLPSLYSPIGMRPWYKCVSDYLEAFDPKEERVKDIGKYQVFYNNVLAWPFEVMGSKVRFSAVSAHRRAVYRRGEVPNTYAQQFAGSPILAVTCTVDVHKKFLAVAVIGWCVNAVSFVIDYFWIEAGEKEDCTESTCSVWGKLREVIEETEYTAADGKSYRVTLTLIDAGYSAPTVTDFCADYTSNVYPVLGRERPAKNQRISEFAEYTTQSGTVGYRVLVDHYKDRLAPILRREWVEESGQQREYHFNAPIDLSDKSLKELTVETRREKTDSRGNISYEWHRPGNARNELWDCLVYAHAAIEIIAWNICIKNFELESIDWGKFWRYLETEKLYYTD